MFKKSAAPSAGGYTLTKSLRFRSSASAYLNRTPASAGNRKTWTYSTWVKRGTLGSSGRQAIFSTASGTSDSTWLEFGWNGSGTDQFYITTYSVATTTTAVYRDPAAWYHIVVAFDTTQATGSNRIKIYVNNVLQANSGGFIPTLNGDYGVNNTQAHNIGNQPSGSLYLDGYQTEINFIDGQALTPSSFGENNADTGVWQPKRYTGTYGTNGFYLPFTDTSSASPTGLGKDFSGASSNVIVGSATNASTTLTVVSTTGISVGNIVTGTGIPNNTYVTAIGVLQVTLSQAATSTTVSNNYTFSGNNWTCNNISLTAGSTYDSMTDVPTLTSATAGNYCVLNPLQTPATVKYANLGFAGTGSDWYPIVGTIGISSGKWYWEAVYNANFQYGMTGIVPSTYVPSVGSYPGATGSLGFGYWSVTGAKYNNGTSTAYGSSYTGGDVIGVAFDADAGTLTFYKNNTSQGTAFTGLTGTYVPAFASYVDCTVNFGQQGFTYTPPSGYVALNTYNLPSSTISNGRTVFDATIYTANGSTNAISNADSGTTGFKPDFVWTKSRTDAYSHELYDSVRGITKVLVSNATNAESTDANGLLSLNSNGFTLGYNNGSNYINGSSGVTWNWQAGQGTTSSNTNGSITSTVSVNATAGFSIVTYTGVGTNPSTIGHGIGVAPSLIIVKGRSVSTDWNTYHVSLGPTKVIYLDLTAAAGTNASYWSNTAPTSSVFTVGNNNETNGSGSTFVAYCWAEIAGFSKFGSYTGNGSTDGPFLYFGFRPKFYMYKRTDSTSNWVIMDSTRNPYNAAGLWLYPNLSNAENDVTSTDQWDFLSNGLKVRSNGSATNANGGTYIYAAFAENPFKNSLAR